MGRASLEGRPTHSTACAEDSRKRRQKKLEHLATPCNTMQHAQGVAGIEKTMKWKLFFFIGWPENSLVSRCQPPVPHDTNAGSLIVLVTGVSCTLFWTVVQLQCSSMSCLPTLSRFNSNLPFGRRILHLQWVVPLPSTAVHLTLFRSPLRTPVVTDIRRYSKAPAQFMTTLFLLLFGVLMVVPVPRRMLSTWTNSARACNDVSLLVFINLSLLFCGLFALPAVYLVNPNHLAICWYTVPH